MKRKCATVDCWRGASRKAEWCRPCRAWLYRWLRMTAAERQAYRERGDLRMGRLLGFGRQHLRRAS